MYAEWGVDWVKMDWCNTEGMTPEDTYPLMSKALNASGRPMSLAMCEWGLDDPWKWGFPIAQSWRATGDHVGLWSNTKGIIGDVAKIPAQYTGKAWGWNDMDMLQTGNGDQAAHGNGKEANMTDTEYRTEFSMWAIAASPLVVTTPIMKCTAAPGPSGPCSVSLTKQHSDAACTDGDTFGCFDNSTMWTDGGCRGEFQCDGKDVTCDVDGAGKHLCTCSSGPVTCTPTITPLQREILLNTEIIEVNQDVTPQGRPVTTAPDISVWARTLSDGSVAVALYNEDDSSKSIGFDFTTIGWATDTVATARDLWAHSDLGSFTGTFPAQTVPAHGTTMLRLTKSS